MRQSLSTFSSENPSDGEEGTASEPSPSGTPEVGSTNTDERPDERSDDMCSQGSEIPLDPLVSEVVPGPEPSSLPIQHQNLLRREQVSHRNSYRGQGADTWSFESYWGDRCRGQKDRYLACKSFSICACFQYKRANIHIVEYDAYSLELAQKV